MGPAQTSETSVNNPSHQRWRERWYDTLRGQATPAFVFDEQIIPAASVWSGARVWVKLFRDLGITKGDRVVLALGPSPAFLMSLVACWCEGISCVLSRKCGDAQHDAYLTQSRLIISKQSQPGGVVPSFVGTPSSDDVRCMLASEVATPDIRLFIQSSGTSSKSKRFVGLSDEGIEAVVDSQRKRMGSQGNTALSVLPWSHAFGLIIDLIPAILDRCVVVRDRTMARDISHTLALGNKHNIDRACLVPLQIDRLMHSEQGRQFLRSLKQGIVGGAPVNPDHVRFLSTTALRVGYGQTEASPGVCLGDQGDWEDRYIGEPVGCSVSHADDGELLAKGPNIHRAVFTAEGYQSFQPGRTLHTNDIVRRDDRGRLYFVGRKDTRFKLCNGRMVDAPTFEAHLYQRGVHAIIVPSQDASSLVACIAAGQHLSGNELASIIPTGLRLNIIEWSGAFPSTPKGEVDRIELARQLFTSKLAIRTKAIDPDRKHNNVQAAA